MTFTVVFLFLLLLLCGFPIIVALSIPSLIYVTLNNLPHSMISYSIFQSLNSFPLIAGPLFILMGNLVNEFGETERLYNFSRLLFNNAKGYSAKVNVIVSLVFAGISGAAVADIGGLGQIEIKAMEQEGFKKDYAAALTSATSTVGPIFPPSIPLIIYAVTVEISTLKALLAGLLPALLIVCALYVFVIWQIPKKLVQKTAETANNTVQMENNFFKAFLSALPMLVLAPLIILFMLTGWFSPSEAGAASVIYIIFIEIFRRKFQFKKFINSMIATYKTIACIFMIIAVASFFSKILTLERFPEMVTSWFLNVSDNKIIILLLINIVCLVVGMFMETVSSIIILSPIFLVVAQAIGVDPIHLGVILVFNLGIGMFTPPFGVGVYTVAKVGNVAPDKVFKALMPLYLPLIVALILITFIPSLTLWVPNLLG
jgi:tripartite ATP-independent transporter DctM subunit